MLWSEEAKSFGKSGLRTFTKAVCLILLLFLASIFIHGYINKRQIEREIKEFRDLAERSHLPHNLWRSYSCALVNGKFICVTTLRRIK